LSNIQIPLTFFVFFFFFYAKIDSISTFFSNLLRQKWSSLWFMWGEDHTTKQD